MNEHEATLLHVRKELERILGWNHSDETSWTHLLSGVQRKLDEGVMDYQNLRDLYASIIEALDEVGAPSAPQTTDGRIRALGAKLEETERQVKQERRTRTDYAQMVQETNEVLFKAGIAAGPPLRERIEQLAARANGTPPGERPPKIHDLKCCPEYFGCAIRYGESMQLRKNDRDFRIGDTLKLREWDPKLGAEGEYTGSKAWRKVVWITDSFEGMKPGYVLMRVSSEGAEVDEPLSE